MPKLNRSIIAFLATIFITFAPPPAIAQNIVETSEKSPQFDNKIQSLLTVGTSASHPDTVLGNKQALIGSETRKLIKLAGVEVSAIGIKPDEVNVAKVVTEAVAKYAATHTMSITVPSGLIVVKRSTGETMSARSYVVNTEVRDARSGNVVWSHTAQIDVGFFLGASNSEVANAIVTRMRSDGLL